MFAPYPSPLPKKGKIYVHVYCFPEIGHVKPHNLQ